MSVLNSIIIMLHYQPFLSEFPELSSLSCERKDILSGERVRTRNEMQETGIILLFPQSENAGSGGRQGWLFHGPRSLISLLSPPSFSGPCQLPAHSRPCFLFPRATPSVAAPTCSSFGGYLISKPARGIRHCLFCSLLSPKTNSPALLC